ncbi:hypothetical protein PO909_008998 [Leuciscus waleckii]
MTFLSYSKHAVLCVAFAFEAVLTREFCQTRPPWNAGPSLANTDRTRKLDHAPTQGRYASHVRARRSTTHTTDLALRATSPQEAVDDSARRSRALPLSSPSVARPLPEHAPVEHWSNNRAPAPGLYVTHAWAGHSASLHHRWGVRFTMVGGNAPVMRAEVATLLAKGAIETVPPAEMKSGFYSPYFIVPKKFDASTTGWGAMCNGQDPSAFGMSIASSCWLFVSPCTASVHCSGVRTY